LSYACKILADSLNPVGDRLTTFEITFPRMVLADLTRHRSFSYSFESTRARPTESIIEQVRNDPYVPTFRKRAKGMGGGEEMDETQQYYAQALWKQQARQAADTAELLLFAGKEHVGRLLEPFAWITGIVSGTTWANYFGLRCPPEGENPGAKWGAQIELQRIAAMMREQYHANTPRSLKWGEWHLPYFVNAVTLRASTGLLFAKASAGKCAGVSFLKHREETSVDQLVEKWEKRLAPSAHWSPGEHPAMAERGLNGFGNYTGFKQLRKFYPGESIYVPPTTLE
jgi:hypothetical protein